MTGFRMSALSRGYPVVLTSVAALATAFMHAPAMAQVRSFNAGDPTVVSGAVTFDRGVTTPGTEVYTINSRTAVLDFIPTDTSGSPGSWINFQNSGTTVRYTNGANTPTFTVLNRIVPIDTSRPIQFNGRVISEIRSGQTVTPGGEVWFYSPGGIILGTTATFDVGSLLLTARDPTGGSGVIGPTNSFRGGGNPGAFIEIQQGATINALSEGSYIALMAPVVRQYGDVRVNGSAAYVAAEDAQITIDNGLFDIIVTTGTDTGNEFPMHHRGSTGGPASTSAADPHRIYMVAVPKNTAITLLIDPTSRLGYDVATVAGVENGRVVLSAGQNVRAGDALLGTSFNASGVIPSTPADLRIDGGTVTSNLFGVATTGVFVGSSAGSPTFLGDVTLDAFSRAQFAAVRQGETSSVAGNLTVRTQGIITSRQVGGQLVIDTLGGHADVFVENGGTVTVGGNLTVSSNAFLVSLPNSGSGPEASSVTAGTASVRAENGAINVGGDSLISAAAFLGRSTDTTFVPRANLFGGSASIHANQGGSIFLNGHTNTIDASAVSFNPISYGDLTGGRANFSTFAGSGALQATGNVRLLSVAVDNDGVIGGGNARAGSAGVVAGGGAISIGGNLDVLGFARGGGDDAGTAGLAEGGHLTVNTQSGSSITVGGLTSLDASARGGTAIGSGMGAGGAATGGRASIDGDGAMTLTGRVLVTASARGGENQRSGPSGVDGGTGTAGSALIVANTGAFSLGGDVNLSAVGTGGASFGFGGAGGAGFGGAARIITVGETARITVAGNALIDASGRGGSGLGIGSRGGAGISGISGRSSNFNLGAALVSVLGAVNVNGNAQLTAVGQGGSGASGGVGRGGRASIVAVGGAMTVGGQSTGLVSGTGGNATIGASGQAGGLGGDAFGGLFYVGHDFAVSGNGVIRLAGLSGTADALGGSGAAGIGGAGGQGGAAVGGVLETLATASSRGLTAGDISYSAVATGGAGGAGAAGFDGGRGGDARGGIIFIGNGSGPDVPQNTGFAAFGNAELNSDATGGAGGAGGSGAAAGIGGAGRGGASTILVRGIPVTVGTAVMSSRGFGGAGSTGGAGTGGQTGIIASNRFLRPERGRLTAGAVTMTATGIGGTGAANGNSTAGFGRVDVSSADVTLDSLDFSSAGATPTPPAFVASAIDGTIAVTGGLRLSVAGSFHLTGALSARTISIASRGVVLGQNAILGGPTTQSISLSNLSPGTVFLGGDEVADENYRLSNAAIGKLQANQIEIRGVSDASGASNIIVSNLSVTGSAGSGATNLVGQNAEFRISGDVVRVEGAVTLQGAGATDTLSLIGTRRVEVVTDRGGSISVTGPATGDLSPLGGTLALSGPVIGVGTEALISQLAANPRFEGRNALLSAPPTTPVPAGFVQANQLILTTTNVAVMQNTGKAGTFGGFTAGSGGLLVRAPEGTQPGSSPAQVVVHGRFQRPDGGFFDGSNAGPGASYASGQSSLFDRSSTVNGCAIGASCGSEPAAVIVASVGAIENVMSANQAAAIEVPTIRVVQVVDQEGLVVQPVITQPVSGAGNASLWDSGEDEEEEDEAGKAAATVASQTQ